MRPLAHEYPARGNWGIDEDGFRCVQDLPAEPGACPNDREVACKFIPRWRYTDHTWKAICRIHPGWGPLGVSNQGCTFERPPPRVRIALVWGSDNKQWIV